MNVLSDPCGLWLCRAVVYLLAYGPLIWVSVCLMLLVHWAVKYMYGKEMSQFLRMLAKKRGKK